MSHDIIQANYDTLEEVAQTFAEAAQGIEEMLQEVRGGRQTLEGEWVGLGSGAFFGEMDGEVLPAVARLRDGLAEAFGVARLISTTFHEAEKEAAALFQGEPIPFPTSEGQAAADPGGTAGGNEGDVWDRILGVAGTIVDAADTIDDVIPIPASLLVAFRLRAGRTYPGQILVRTPQWLSRLEINRGWVKGLAGLAPSLSHIKAANLVSRQAYFDGFVIPFSA